MGREPGILVLGKAIPEKLASLNLPKETEKDDRCLLPDNERGFNKDNLKQQHIAER